MTDHSFMEPSINDPTVVSLNAVDDHILNAPACFSSPTQVVPHNLNPGFDAAQHINEVHAADLYVQDHALVGEEHVLEDVSSDLNGISAVVEEPYVVWYSPDGTKMWCPKVPVELKPVVGKEFLKFDDALAMYQQYAIASGFSIRKGQTKKAKDHVETHKYIRCNKAGKPQTKRKFDTIEEQCSFLRKNTFTLSDCKAHVCIKYCRATTTHLVFSFVESHNHSLVDTFNRDLTKVQRKLPFYTKQFIHNMSLNRIGPNKSHRFMVSLMGGHHRVKGTVTDFKNFSQSLRIYIGDRDSQLVVERMRYRFNNIHDFFFDLIVIGGRLKSIFWADETSKLNYKVFGDVLSFDATYQTNRYNMIFVPFTGVDNHKHCVTFGAGLIHSETIETYKWLLDSFMEAHAKQPKMVFTDQDPSMRQAVIQSFPEARHRLCMWHVMKKLPVKIPGSVLNNTDFRSDLHRLVWSKFIRPDTFETRWGQLMDMYHLQNHEWLGEMFRIRDRWIPAYFREIPMCCLMRTTSRCESSNASFKVNSSSANTLVQWMLCYETRIESQRYKQRESEFKSMQASYVSITGLPIEKHAFEFYTLTIFLEVQKEIVKGNYSCYISDTSHDDGLKLYAVSHLNQHRDLVNTFQVKYNQKDNTCSCSCMGFTRIGYLCRHVFCVYRVNQVDKIPACYISDRWRRDVLPRRVYEIQNRYGVDNSQQSQLRSEIFELVSECLDAIRCDPERLQALAVQLKEIKEEISNTGPLIDESIAGNAAVVEELIGQPLDVEVSINNPDGIRNKGCGKHRRMIGPAENKIHKPPKAPRFCKTCKEYVIGHDSRNCAKMAAKSNDDGNQGSSNAPTSAP